ncbi:hypothetical protein O181_009568 [Austropuccinia psidii MF-1]|uniref:CCHC-type domain-containing protein n=1 Tax=Austropuccinia psidii MF-1 TaxID=1389203 RepID=A0A9Q3GJJ9_9BASI|nr:hypothetical protein [Austropuccinia psidii MF-1]
MKPQPQGHVIDNPYHHDDIKPDSMFMNKERSPSQYQDEDNMSYSKKEALKQLPESSSWPKFSGAGEYDHMAPIDHIDGLFIDVPSIPDYWITARLNTAFKVQYSVEKDPYEWCLRQSKRLKAIDPQIKIQMRNHKLLTQMPGELEHSVKCRCNQNFTVDDIANTLQDVRKRTNIGKYTPYKSMNKKKNSCHNCGSIDHYANNCPKAKKKVHAMEKVPEEESPTEDSESDSMGDAIREQYDEEQDPREEFLVEYQE